VIGVVDEQLSVATRYLLPHERWLTDRFLQRLRASPHLDFSRSDSEEWTESLRLDTAYIIDVGVWAVTSFSGFAIGAITAKTFHEVAAGGTVAFSLMGIGFASLLLGLARKIQSYSAKREYQRTRPPLTGLRIADSSTAASHEGRPMRQSVAVQEDDERSPGAPDAAAKSMQWRAAASEAADTGTKVIEAVRELLTAFPMPGESRHTTPTRVTRDEGSPSAMVELTQNPSGMSQYQSLAMMAGLVRWFSRESGHSEAEILEALEANYRDLRQGIIH